MKLLVLGGTVFVGRHIVETAITRGHEVTLFNRGRSDPDLFPDLERITGDRSMRLDALKAGKWDSVIDTCGYVAEDVRRSAVFLKGRTPHYTFISSASVYKDWAAPEQWEDSQLHAPATTGADLSVETYGPRKVACEGMVKAHFPEAHFIVRPVLIVGPWDPTDRFTYWPLRVAKGGEVLAPMPPERRVQVVDVRDLAEWIVKAIEKDVRGTYNACGLAMGMESLLELCAAETKASPQLTWVSGEFLQQQNVAAYQELPLWIPGIDDSFIGIAALKRGLVSRPLARTVHDTYMWALGRRTSLRAGLSAEREAQLLTLWHAQCDKARA